MTHPQPIDLDVPSRVREVGQVVEAVIRRPHECDATRGSVRVDHVPAVFHPSHPATGVARA
jgi:hypothetical protein